MDRKDEQALNPAHTKKKGVERDHKACDDTDIGIHKYGPDNVRAQLPGLWSIPPKEVVGLGPERLMTNDYCKGKEGEKREKPDLLGEILDHGPPLLNISKPNRVL